MSKQIPESTMTEKKIEDYLHLYLGCEVQTPDGVGKLHSVAVEANGEKSNRVKIFFGRMVKTKNSIDGGYDKTRNHGDYNIAAKRYEPIKSKGITDDGFDMPGGVTPILRPLSDMTEEEARECWHGNHDQRQGGVTNPKCALTDYTFHADLNPYQWFAVTHYLLSKHFDLFGLIESGIAIDKTKHKE